MPFFHKMIKIPKAIIKCLTCFSQNIRVINDNTALFTVNLKPLSLHLFLGFGVHHLTPLPHLSQGVLIEICPSALSCRVNINLD